MSPAKGAPILQPSQNPATPALLSANKFEPPTVSIYNNVGPGDDFDLHLVFVLATTLVQDDSFSTEKEESLSLD